MTEAFDEPLGSLSSHPSICPGSGLSPPGPAPRDAALGGEEPGLADFACGVPGPALDGDRAALDGDDVPPPWPWASSALSADLALRRGHSIGLEPAASKRQAGSRPAAGEAAL